MPKVRVQLNGPGVHELLADPGVVEDLESRGDRVLAAAEAAAPVDTGEYYTSLHSWLEHTDRPAVRVGSDAPHAMVVEARHGVLAQALDAAGGAA
jgi:hypothetical protein